MKISNELRGQVRTLEREIRSKSDEATRITQERRQVQAEATRFWSTMNFRERNFAGGFGGDRTKVARYREFQTLIAELDSKAIGLQREVEELNTQVASIIGDHLGHHDADYQLLLQSYDAASTMKEAVDTFIGKIQQAISEVSNAKGMETLDLFTKSKTISVLSYMGNSGANNAIRAVQKATDPFQKALDRYNEFLGSYQAPQLSSEISDGVDLVFDVVFDGFDFMSLFTLSALGNADSRLRSARTKVAEVDMIVSDHRDRTSRAVLAYAQSARAACA